MTGEGEGSGSNTVFIDIMCERHPMTSLLLANSVLPRHPFCEIARECSSCQAITPSMLSILFVRELNCDPAILSVSIKCMRRRSATGQYGQKLPTVSD